MALLLGQLEMGMGGSWVVLGAGSWRPVPTEGDVMGWQLLHEVRLPHAVPAATSSCDTHVLRGGWTPAYSPSARLSACQKLLMLNSKRKLSKEQEQRMLFQQPGRVQVAGRWLCGLANTSSKMFIVDFQAEEVGEHFFPIFVCLFFFDFGCSA